MDEKFLEDYTLKDIYANFLKFKEKYPTVLNRNGYYGRYDNFEVKLKFVNAVVEYKKLLEQIPYVSQNSDYFVDRIFNKFQNVRRIDMDNKAMYINGNALKYDERGNVFLDRDNTEIGTFPSLINLFTKTALEGGSEIFEKDGYGELYEVRTQYIIEKLLEMEDNRVNGIDIEPNCVPKSFLEGKQPIYRDLINLFGEETMLNFSSENMAKINGKLKMRCDTNLKYINEMMQMYKKAPNVFNEKNKLILMGLVRTDKAQEGISEYESLLNDLPDVPQELKKQMTINLKIGLKDIVEKKISQKEFAAGLYHAQSKIVEIDSKSELNAKYKNTLHELTHAATTTYLEDGTVDRIGFDNNYQGTALNEGATEYFTQKMYSAAKRPKVYVSYREQTAIFTDLVKLYGENVMTEAMLNGPEKLEELMLKDGKNYTEILEVLDDYHRKVYSDKEKPFWKMRKEDESKEMYSKAGNLIEEIKIKRAIENPGFVVEESEWKKVYKDLFEEKKLEEKSPNKYIVKISSWFQKLKNIFKYEFDFSDEIIEKKPLGLNTSNRELNKETESNLKLDSGKNTNLQECSNAKSTFNESIKLNHEKENNFEKVNNNVISKEKSNNENER